MSLNVTITLIHIYELPFTLYYGIKKIFTFLIHFLFLIVFSVLSIIIKEVKLKLTLKIYKYNR